MDDAARRVREAANDARSGDDLVSEPEMIWDGDMMVPAPLDSPLDRETLDERASTQLGPGWEPRRRDAD